VRYASVYQDFREPKDFNEFVRSIKAEDTGKA
jgi:transcriptional regulator NrdR family protein